MGHDREMPPCAVKTLVEESLKTKTKVIMGCDANAHHSIWRSSDTNARGESLIEFILRSNLVVCNKGDAPTFVTKYRQEVLDVTLASPELNDKISEWQVLREHSFSDHRYISFSLSGRTSKTIFPPNVRKADWNSYRESFNMMIPKIPETNMSTVQDIEHAVERITKAFNISLKAECPRARVSTWIIFKRELSLLKKRTF
ncbi:uncharacterized protein LOC142229993 [Haematobia irritans]|uniref:uncharacterized protein LOC142229993 n=1 Tax=Haematobia irritans TaxID=7368 RepID=UPI003F50B737